MYAVVSLGMAGKPIREIPPGIQNRVIRDQSDSDYFDTFVKIENDQSIDTPTQDIITKLRHAIDFLGGLFHLQLMSDWAERRVFSFALSDPPSAEVKEVLSLGVQLGFFHRSAIGNKDGTGRTTQYVMTRMLAPKFYLDATSFAGYKFMTSSALAGAMRNPDSALRTIKARGLAMLDDEQLELAIFGDE